MAASIDHSLNPTRPAEIVHPKRLGLLLAADILEEQLESVALHDLTHHGLPAGGDWEAVREEIARTASMLRATAASLFHAQPDTRQRDSGVIRAYFERLRKEGIVLARYSAFLSELDELRAEEIERRLGEYAG